MYFGNHRLESARVLNFVILASFWLFIELLVFFIKRIISINSIRYISKIYVCLSSRYDSNGNKPEIYKRNKRIKKLV